QKLKSNAATQLQVLCAVDEPHAAATDPIEDSIMGNNFANLGKSKVLNLRMNRSLHLLAGIGIRGKQPFDLPAQFRIAMAGSVQPGTSPIHIAFCRAME